MSWRPYWSTSHKVSRTTARLDASVLINFAVQFSQDTLTVISSYSLNSTYFRTSTNVHEYIISIPKIGINLLICFTYQNLKAENQIFAKGHHIVGGKNRNKTPDYPGFNIGFHCLIEQHPLS